MVSYTITRFMFPNLLSNNWNSCKITVKFCSFQPNQCIFTAFYFRSRSCHELYSVAAPCWCYAICLWWCISGNECVSSEPVLQTDLRSVSQQGPQWVRWQGLSPGKRQRVRLLSVESDVLAALVITFQLFTTVQSHQIPRPHLSEDLPHDLHLPVWKMTCRSKHQC